MRPHLERLQAEPAAVLRELQSRFHSRNCPAVAAATLLFLRTGASRAAVSSLTGGFVCTEPARKGGSIAPFVAAVAAAPVETCAVVGAFAPPAREHYFVLAKLTGGVFYVDAYTIPGVFDRNVRGRTSWANRFEYFPEFVCRAAPP